MILAPLFFYPQSNRYITRLIIALIQSAKPLSKDITNSICAGRMLWMKACINRCYIWSIYWSLIDGTKDIDSLYNHAPHQIKWDLLSRITLLYQFGQKWTHRYRGYWTVLRSLQLAGEVLTPSGWDMKMTRSSGRLLRSQSPWIGPWILPISIFDTEKTRHSMAVAVTAANNTIVYDRIAEADVKLFKIETSQRKIEISLTFVKAMMESIEIQVTALTNNDRCKIILSFMKKKNIKSKLSTNLFKKEHQMSHQINSLVAACDLNLLRSVTSRNLRRVERDWNHWSSEYPASIRQFFDSSCIQLPTWRSPAGL